MTPKERRGKRLFLALATLIILEKLVGAGLTFGGGLAEVRWLKSIVQPVGFALGVALLWYGDNWLRWLVGAACVFVGGTVTFVSALLLIRLAGITPPEATGFFLQALGYPLGIAGLYGLFYLVAGFLFIFSPSLKAFFRYQREGWQIGRRRNE